MMQFKHAIYALVFLSSTHLYANVPIESRGLSQSDAGSSPSSSYGSSVANTPVAEANVPTNINWQIMQKNQQLENDIRMLRGRIEEQENTIEQLKNELNNRYTDLDQRLELLQQKMDPDSAATEDNQQDTPPSVNTTTTVAPKTNNTTNTSTPVATSPNTNLTTAANTNTSQQPTELEKAAYTVALDAYKQGGAKKAIAPMQNFIKNHPNSIYISNAYFWLAEFNLAIEPTNYTEAKKNYNIVVNQYPQSSKASRALYQLYSIAKDVDRNTALTNQYKTKLLKQYPKSEEAGYLKK